MKHYQSVLPAATRIQCEQRRIVARAKANLHKLFNNGFYYCTAHEGVCERVESDQGQPPTCDVCGSVRLEWNPPIWTHLIDDNKIIEPADLTEAGKEAA